VRDSIHWSGKLAITHRGRGSLHINVFCTWAATPPDFSEPSKRMKQNKKGFNIKKFVLKKGRKKNEKRNKTEQAR
jgi:hypothetical protein